MGELIFTLLGIWIAWTIFLKIITVSKTVVRKFQGKPEPYFGPAEITITDEEIEDSGTEFKSVKIRGIIPVDTPSTVTVRTKIMDAA